MTELRQKMISAMELKNLSPHTQRAYLAAVTGITRHYRQSPAAITKEMIEDYLLSLKKAKSPNSCDLVLTGLRFFYAHVAEEKLGFMGSRYGVLILDFNWSNFRCSALFS